MVAAVDLAVVSCGVCTAGTTTWFDGSLMRGPAVAGGVPAPVAMLVTWPTSRSAWVTVCCAVQVAAWVGAKVVGEHDGASSALASTTATAVRVTLPLLVTVMT